MRVYRRALRRFSGAVSYTEAMARISASRALRAGGSTLAISAVLLALVACESPNPVAVQNSNTAKPEQTASATATASSTEVTGVPMTLTCDDILSADALYSLKGGQNYEQNPDFAPKAGTTAAAIAGLKGVTCGYVNQTSGETFTIAVAQITPESMPTLKEHLVTTLTTSSFVPSYSPSKSVDGYFAVTRGVGEAQVATSAYWIAIASDTFSEPGEVEEVVHDVEKSLGR